VINFLLLISLSEIAPAQIVSSRLNLSFHPAQNSITSLFCLQSQLHKDEILRNEYDLSFNPEVNNYDPDHVALLYDLNTEMIIPSEKASQLKKWWCLDKLQKPLDQCNIPENWLCEDMVSCDIPETIFLHFKKDTQISLNLGVSNLYDGMRTGIVKGWDPDNFIDTDNDGFIDIVVSNQWSSGHRGDIAVLKNSGF